jgi:hypothetical protein
MAAGETGVNRVAVFEMHGRVSPHGEAAMTCLNYPRKDPARGRKVNWQINSPGDEPVENHEPRPRLRSAGGRGHRPLRRMRWKNFLFLQLLLPAPVSRPLLRNQPRGKNWKLPWITAAVTLVHTPLDGIICLVFLKIVNFLESLGGRGGDLRSLVFILSKTPANPQVLSKIRQRLN